MLSLIFFSTISFLFSGDLDTSDPPRSYTAKYINTSPIIDGKIEDKIWAMVPWSNSFIDIEGHTKPEPDYSTEVKILYNKTHLFIAARMEEPHVWAYVKEKNKHIYKYENDFEVFIDPNGDHCNYYELELNAINTIWELSLPYPYRNQGKARDPDNMDGMISKCFISGSLNDPNDTDQYWSVEIALPFSGFKKFNATTIPPQKGDYWRINFSRVQWDHILNGGKYEKKLNSKENNWVWTPQYEINMHAPEHWGYLFFENISDDFDLDVEWKIEEGLIDVYQQIKAGKAFIEIESKLDHPNELNYIRTQESYILSYTQPKLNFEYKMNNKTCFWKTKR